MTESSDPKGRRTFLRGLAGVGATTTVFVVAGGRVTEAPAADREAEAPAEPRGYRLTPHIKTYYDKARF